MVAGVRSIRRGERMWGRMASCAAVANRRASRFPIGPQLTKLPTNTSRGHSARRVIDQPGRYQLSALSAGGTQFVTAMVT